MSTAPQLRDWFVSLPPNCEVSPARLQFVARVLRSRFGVREVVLLPELRRISALGVPRECEHAAAAFLLGVQGELARSGPGLARARGGPPSRWRA